MMDEMCQQDVQFVVLGTGEEKYENMFRHFAWKYQGKVSANIFYSEAMSHKVYASCDAFLMPSLFEPCGLSQLMSLRYGTLPIVRETGGLKDTVIPYNEYEGTGTGFSFANYNAHEMFNTLKYAQYIFYEKKREWNKMVDRAMQPISPGQILQNNTKRCTTGCLDAKIKQNDRKHEKASLVSRRSFFWRILFFLCTNLCSGFCTFDQASVRTVAVIVFADLNDLVFDHAPFLST